MKLYNKTRVPTPLLRAVLSDAAHRIGARSRGVVVKVTAAQYRGCTGEVGRASLVADWHLIRRTQRQRERCEYKWVSTDCAWMKISLPCNYSDPLAAVVRFWEVALHEWAHVKDAQMIQGPQARRSPSGRRPRWADRPEERLAMSMTAEVLEAVSGGRARGADDVILALAIWLEQAKQDAIT